MRAINRTRGSLLCAKVETAAGLTGRGHGLLGRGGLGAGEGMLFEAARLLPIMWMHMFFMRFPIDIVFLDRRGAVLKVDRNLKPWRVSSIVFGAHRALEIGAGAAESSGTQIGDRIELIET